MIGLTFVVLVVGASRIDLDVHYPADTVAGMAFALGGVGLTGATIRAAHPILDFRAEPIDRQESRP